MKLLNRKLDVPTIVPLTMISAVVPRLILWRKDVWLCGKDIVL